MKYLIILFINCFFVVVSVRVSAQDTWTLNQCIQHALENNNTHKGYNIDVKSERLDVFQSKMDLLPSISASTSGGMTYGRSIVETTIIENEYFGASGRVNTNFNLFQGFTRLNRIAYAKYKLKAAELNKLNHEDDLAFDILTRYYNIVYYSGLLKIAMEQLEISDFNSKKTRAQVETGLKAKSDLLQIQAGLEKEKLDIMLAENRLELEKFRLMEMMNYQQSKDLKVDMNSISEVKGFVPVSDSLYYDFSSFSPLLRKSKVDVLAAKKNVAITRGYYLPSVGLSASISSRYNEIDTYKEEGREKVRSFNDQFDKNLRKYVGASISIPIFNRNQQRTRVKHAKLAHERAINNYEERKQSLFFELTNNTRELIALYKTCIQAQKQVEADQLAFNVANQKYNEGLINIIELLNVKESLATSRSQLLLAKIQFEIKNKTIEFYKGNRFWE